MVVVRRVSVWPWLTVAALAVLNLLTLGWVTALHVDLNDRDMLQRERIEYRDYRVRLLEDRVEELEDYIVEREEAK